MGEFKVGDALIASDISDGFYAPYYTPHMVYKITDVNDNGFYGIIDDENDRQLWSAIEIRKCFRLSISKDEDELEVDKIHTIIPKDPAQRKQCPVYSGVINYFPDAMYSLAKQSWIGNEQHNPGTKLHWDRSKSGDELDALMRHIVDGDWEAVAWRAMANLQKKIEDGYVPAGFEDEA